MQVAVRFGRGTTNVEVDADRLVAVLRPSPPPPLADPDADLEAALRSPIGSAPLAEIARGRRDAVILVSDITRPAPNALFLRHIAEALNGAGLPDEAITILVATGAHRSNEGAELDELISPDAVRRFRVVNHVARDPASHVDLGRTPLDVPILIDGTYVDADLKIATGLIEPHYMAGFSGGRKLVCPGIAAIDTVREFHSARLLMHPAASTTVLAGNPVHETSLACARAAGVDFIVNAAVDEGRRVTGLWAGELVAAHETGCAAVGAAARAYCAEPVDIVVTSNAGYPLDASVYQATKGMVGALPILKPGGTVVIAAACPEGLGSADFAQVVHDHGSIEDALDRLGDPNRFVIDQWGVVMLAKAVQRCEVMIHAEGLSDADARAAFLTPVAGLQAGLDRALVKHGAGATVAVIPDGPYVVAELGQRRQGA